MTRPILLTSAIAVLVAAAPVRVNAQEPRVRASVATKGDTFVGQRVTVVVELLAPGFFAGAPSFDMPDPPGMLLVPPESSPTVSSESIDGTSYTVQRHELSAFARRAGPQTIPPITTRFRFKRAPLDKETVAAAVTTEALTFTAKSPPGADSLGGIISARELTAVVQWTPREPGASPAKAGDAFTRTVTFAAPDVPAMAFPAFPATKVDGLGVYPKPPEVLDHSERGELRGQRRDAVTYVCERAGTFVIPGARLSWFDLDANEVKMFDVQAQTVHVAPNPALAAAAPPASADAAAKEPAWRVPAMITAFVAFATTAAYASRRWGRRLLAPYRPVHLAPLNPVHEEATS